MPVRNVRERAYRGDSGKIDPEYPCTKNAHAMYILCTWGGLPWFTPHIPPHPERFPDPRGAVPLIRSGIPWYRNRFPWNTLRFPPCCICFPRYRMLFSCRRIRFPRLADDVPPAHCTIPVFATAAAECAGDVSWCRMPDARKPRDGGERPKRGGNAVALRDARR